MRQSGILAAAGLYALDHNLDRLKDDHYHARKLAESIQGLHGLHISMDTVQSNMVYVQTEKSADKWKQQLEEQGVLCFALGENTLRLVTHLHIDEEQVEEVGKVFEDLSRK
jgi:threonine aldolase